MTPKNVLTRVPKSNCFRTHFGSERVHGSQTLHKSPWQHFYPNFQLIQDKLSWKTCLWIRLKISGLFFNMLTADNVYSAHNLKKFHQRIQTQLSEKWKTISRIFIPFSKSAANSSYLQKKDHLDSLNISQVIDSEKCSYLNAKKQLFQNIPPQWTCSRVPNTAQVCMTALLS